MVQYAKCDSPLGPLLLGAEGSDLVGLWLNRCEPEAPFTGKEGPEGPFSANEEAVLADAVAWLDAYFRGEEKEITFSLNPRGTVFQKLVWQRLQQIPYGQTVSYGQLAREIGQALGKEKMSAQAIGQAVGRNPISIIIPCHRVVGARGQLTGYAGGLENKIWLLRHEGGYKNDD